MSRKKYGVLIVNLGTPESPTIKKVMGFLSEFLSDKRVIDKSRFLWLPLLYGIILPFRSCRLTKLYQSIWMKDGSPLLVYSRRQHMALVERLPNVVIELAMGYGQPSLRHAIESVLSHYIEKLVILPLYPQYSSSTTAAIWDAVSRILIDYRRLPSISFIRDYAEHPMYISALVLSIKRSFSIHNKPDRLLISFHSIPRRYIIEGDDYHQRCIVTYNAIVTSLKPDYPSDKIIITFQSKFGYDPWLIPATDKTIQDLPLAEEVQHIQIICPGFAADCLETLEEIQVKNKKIFEKAGGRRFYYIPALNDDAVHIDLLNELIMTELH